CRRSVRQHGQGRKGIGRHPIRCLADGRRFGAALRVRLLDRSTRGVVATIYGSVLIKRSRAALDELRNGLQEIESLTDHATGQVRIGCPESISSAVLPSIAELFFKRYPRAVLDVDDVNFGMLAPLLDRKIDLVI